MTMTTVRPEDFAASGDVADLYLGSKDATQEVADAFLAINTGGVQARVLLEGKYRISSPLLLPWVDGLILEGAGPESGFIVDPTFPTASDVIASDLTVAGRGVLSTTTVAVQALRNSMYIQIASVTGFAKGDLVQLETFQTSAAGTSVVRRQILQVQAVVIGTGSLIFDQSIGFTMPVGATVKRIGCRHGLIVRNVGTWGAGAVEHTAFNLKFERGTVIENFISEDSGLKATQGSKGGGLILNTGYQQIVSNVRTLCSGSSGENAIGFKNLGRLKATNIEATQTRFGIGLSWGCDNQLSHIAVDSADTRGVKLAGACRCQLDHLQLNNIGHTALAITQFSHYNTISDVQIVYVPSAGQGTGVWTNGESSSNNQVLGIVVDAAPNSAIANAAGDRNNIYQVARLVRSGAVFMGDASSRVAYI